MSTIRGKTQRAEGKCLSISILNILFNSLIINTYIASGVMEVRRTLFVFLFIVLMFIYGCESKEKEEETIDVQIDVEGAYEYGRVYFFGETNLPDHGELVFSVEGNDYKHKTKGVISDNTFESGVFSDKGDPLEPGTYQLHVELSKPSLQEDRFLEAAGEAYENLSGELMEKSDLEKSLSYSNTFTVQEYYISESDAEEIIKDTGLNEDDKLLEMEVNILGEITAKIELQKEEDLSDEKLAITRYRQISDKLMEREDWEELTIEFVDIGTISMDRFDQETDEDSSYFREEDIENKLSKE